MPAVAEGNMKLKLEIVLVLTIVLAAAPSFADVTVTQNIGPGATSWPDSPLIQTVSNPSSQLIVGESFGAATSISETFTVPAPNNYSLQTIYLYVGGGTGTTATATVTVNLYDLGGRIAPNPSGYSAGINLLGGGKGLPISYTTQANGLLRLEFDGSDQAMLIAGHMYAFELAGLSGTTPLNWLRTTSDTYPGGAAYRNRAWINGTNARDFGMAVYGVVNTNPVPPTEATINGAALHQQMDGFGAGAVFLDAGLDPLTDANMDALYGTEPNQMGLTLIRLRIAPDGNWTTAIQDGQKAKQRGAKILATPWTPPASMKDNDSMVNGGSVIPSQYPNLAAYFNSFTDTMASNGAPVDVLSLQNEPDFTATYESCRWNASQLDAFFHDFANGVKTPMIMPESFHYDQTLSNPTLNDPAAAANVAYIGGHLYGAGIQDYPLAHSLGKHTWMTEYLVNDQTIDAAVDTAQQISDTLTAGNMSAYIWWKTIGDANGLLNAAGVLQRRAYVMAQFSKFVRPGDFRIDVPFNSSPLGLSAFMDPNSGRFAIVAVNDTTLPIAQSITINGIRTSSLTPWITSATQSLEPQSRLAAREGEFTYTLPSFSVVTFTGLVRKLTMCHNGHSISVDINAVPAHIAIGDYVGSCL
jgi:glucuronoarabinoxylan endo-1,4-beta-xylanase